MGVSLVQGRVAFVTALSYEVDPVVLRGLVPAGTEIDTYEGCTLLSLVAMQFGENRLLGVPMPFARRYDQIDLHFYVRRRVDGAWRRGVAFVRELLPVGSMASFGHLLYGEAYQRLPVSSKVHPPEDGAIAGRAVYRWLVNGDVHRLDAEFSGDLRHPAEGSIEAFALDRHWGYVFHHHADLAREYRVDHPPWRIWPAASARLGQGSTAVFGNRFHHVLAERPRAVLVAEGSRVQMHRPSTITGAAARAAAGPAETARRPRV